MVVSVSIDYKEWLRRWIPRILGVTPLLLFLTGLLRLGPTQAGLAMVIVLTVVIAALLILYTEISLLSFPQENPTNPLLLKLHRPLALLTSRACTKQQIGERPWWAMLAAGFLRAVIATPFRGIIGDLDYEGSEDQKIELDINRKAIDPFSTNEANKPGIAMEEFRIRNMRLAEINGTPLPDLSQANEELNPPKLLHEIDVSGGRVRVEYRTPLNDTGGTKVAHFTFIPNLGCIGRFEFPYTVCWWKEDSQLSLLQRETGTIRIQIRSKPEAHEHATIGEFGSSQLNRGAMWDANMLANSMMGLGVRWIRESRWLISYLMQLRIQVTIVAVCWLLFQTQQVRDVLLALMLDKKPMAFALATLFGTALCLLLWHSARQLTRLFPEIHRMRKSGSSNILLQTQGIFSNSCELLLFLIAWLSIVLITVPMAREAYQNQAEPYRWARLLVAPYGLFLVGAAFIALWRMLDQPQSTWKVPFTTRFTTFFVLGLFAPLAAQLLDANTIPTTLGSLSVLFWFLCILLIFSTTIYRFSIVSGFPLLSILLGAYYLVNINRLNDNHAIRLRPDSDRIQYRAELERNQTLPSLKTKLDDWIQARDSNIRRHQIAGSQYPIYVVSAQGGGIYAAYHTAKSLATLTDSIPEFPKHIFAISGVSGGSIGSTVYRMALSSQDYSCNDNKLGPPNLGERIDHYFQTRDSLATILASLLFGDVTQRIFPLAVAQWDRAVGLELSFENRYGQPVIWEKGKCYQPIKLDGSFYLDQDRPFEPAVPASSRDNAPMIATRGKVAPTQASVTPTQETSAILPYLVLNTTIVENGQRLVLAPFRLEQTDAVFHQPWRTTPNITILRDLRFSTAAALSARFPIVSPYGFFPNEPNRRLVDGGLYDNSGAITAQEIISNLSTIISDRCSKSDPRTFNPYCHIRLIPIAIVDKKAVSLAYSSDEEANRRRRFRVFGWSAIEAVLSSREARLQKAADLFDRSGTSLNSEAQNQYQQEKVDRGNAEATSPSPPPSFRTVTNPPARALVADIALTQPQAVRRAKRPAETCSLQSSISIASDGTAAHSEVSLQGPKSGCEPARILLTKDYRLDNADRVFSVPLGWNISCQAMAFINDQIQPIDLRAYRDGRLTNIPAEYHGITCEKGETIARAPFESSSRSGHASHPSMPFWNLIERLRNEIDLDSNRADTTSSPAATTRTALSDIPKPGR